MSVDTKIPFEQLDFALPIQRFRIEYSLVEKNAVPFVREFVLRLLWLSKMTLGEIAAFMGFTQKEARVVATQLFELNEVAVGEDRRLELTQKAKAYFRNSADGSPRIAQLTDRRDTFRFELVSFGYVPKDKRSEDWRFSIKLEPDMEKRSRSAVFARKAFQRRFYEIYHAGDIERFSTEGKEIPDIYKISDVSPQREDYVKIAQTLFLNIQSGEVERSKIESFDEQDEIIEKITDAILSHRKSENLASVSRAMEELGGEFLLECLSKDGIDIPKFLLGALNERESSGAVQRMFGSLQLPNNWDRVVGLFKKHLHPTSDKMRSSPDKVTWLAPSNPFWGRSDKIQECISTISELSIDSKTNFKFFNFSLKLPLYGKEDKAGKSWLSEFRDFRPMLHGYVEGYGQGDVELILYPSRFAVVLFHVVPSKNWVPIPLGFTTEDKNLTVKIEHSLKDYLSESDGYEGVKDLGRIADRQPF